MKNIIKFLIITCVITNFVACDEEQRGQYPLSNAAPSQITDLHVEEAFGGGVRLRYNLPDDRNLLYVVARYTLDTGQPMEVKSSLYQTSIDIVGYSQEADRQIEIRSVSRSRVESEPQIINVRPLPSPIHDILDNIITEDDFGGIRITWENDERVPITILVSRPISDDSDMMEQLTNFVSSVRQGRANIRNLPSEPVQFTIRVRDNYGNLSDARKIDHLPIEEYQCDKRYFRRWNADPQIPYNDGWGAQIENMWDNNFINMDNTSHMFHTDNATIMSFTFDMGHEYILSRFKMWHRGGSWVFRHHNPQRFSLYGSASPLARRANDALEPDQITDGTEKWIFLGYFDDTNRKPSGLPVGQYTAEDTQLAAIDGLDYDLDETLAPVRYIRMDVHRTWGFSAEMHITELTFWGVQPK